MRELVIITMILSSCCMMTYLAVLFFRHHCIPFGESYDQILMIFTVFVFPSLMGFGVHEKLGKIPAILVIAGIFLLLSTVVMMNISIRSKHIKHVMIDTSLSLQSLRVLRYNEIAFVEEHLLKRYDTEVVKLSMFCTCNDIGFREFFRIFKKLHQGRAIIMSSSSWMSRPDDFGGVYWLNVYCHEDHDEHVKEIIKASLLHVAVRRALGKLGNEVSRKA